MSEQGRVGGKSDGTSAPEARRGPHQEHLVPAELGGRPLDGIVRVLFGTTWGNARKWIGSGKVRVDGQTVLDHGRGVRAGVVVVLTMSAPKPKTGGGRNATPALDDAAILHVDTHVVVVNKPAGVSTIPFDERETGTLDELVRAWLSKRVKRGDRGDRPTLGIVHRLDKETSGVIVFTRTWLAKQSLTQQFRVHTVHRRYLAIAHGVVQARTLRSHIVPDRGDGLRGTLRRREGRGAREEGQLAITHIEPVEALEGATLVACKLETGRTHQIRVHLSESGHPVVGERVYIRGYQGEVIPAPRLMLHAAELGFVHPATNAEVRFEKEPPADFEETLRRLRK